MKLALIIYFETACDKFGLLVLKLWLNYTCHKTPNKKLYATEQTTVALILLRFILIRGLQVLATFLIPPRPEFALKEEDNLYLGQLPVKNQCLS